MQNRVYQVPLFRQHNDNSLYEKNACKWITEHFLLKARLIWIRAHCLNFQVYRHNVQIRIVYLNGSSIRYLN